MLIPENENLEKPINDTSNVINNISATSGDNSTIMQTQPHLTDGVENNNTSMIESIRDEFISGNTQDALNGTCINSSENLIATSYPDRSSSTCMKTNEGASNEGGPREVIVGISSIPSSRWRLVSIKYLSL